MCCFRPSVSALLVAVLAGCGGGGGSASPPETLYVAANVWHGAADPDAEMVSPEEFRSRQASGTIDLTTSDTQQSTSKSHQDHIQSERSFLEGQSDLNDRRPGPRPRYLLRAVTTCCLAAPLRV